MGFQQNNLRALPEGYFDDIYQGGQIPLKSPQIPQGEAKGVFGVTRAESVLQVRYRPNTTDFSNVRV